MPTLDWIGKRAVLNHHREIPFHLLEPNTDLSFGDPVAANLLVEGDNLLAPKALLPYYSRQVKAIYIDPPYNTGNERWVYNDAVNSPEMREWLGQVVGGEAEDLSRHDKWLCMMYPRAAAPETISARRRRDFHQHRRQRALEPGCEIFLTVRRRHSGCRRPQIASIRILSGSCPMAVCSPWSTRARIDGRMTTVRRKGLSGTYGQPRVVVVVCS